MRSCGASIPSKFIFKNFYSKSFVIIDNVKLDTPTTISENLSAVHRGQEFEKFAMSLLEKFNLQLVPTGKRGDYGLDFRGYWSFPDNKRVGIVGQCKHEKKKLAPHYVRDFSGSMEHESDENTLGLLVTSQSWSLECRHHINVSKRAMMLMQLDIENQKIKRVVVNNSTRKLIPGLSFSKDLFCKDALILTYKPEVIKHPE